MWGRDMIVTFIEGVKVIVLLLGDIFVRNLVTKKLPRNAWFNARLHQVGYPLFNQGSDLN